MPVLYQGKDSLSGVEKESQDPAEPSHVSLRPQTSPALEGSSPLRAQPQECAALHGTRLSGEGSPSQHCCYLHLRSSLALVVRSLFCSIFLHSSRHVVYVSRLARTCFARSDWTLQQRGQTLTCTLSKTLPAPEPALPQPLHPCCLWAPATRHGGTSFRPTPKALASGALPGRARVGEIRGGSVCSPSPTGSQSLPLASAKPS